MWSCFFPVIIIQAAVLLAVSFFHLLWFCYYLVFDIETVQKGIPLDFKKVAALGVILAIGTGVGAVLFGAPFLTQTFGHFHLPVFGETELATVVFI